MTQTIVLYRLVGTIDVTLNPMAATEIDERQLRQGLETLEVACIRRARFHERSAVALRQSACDIYRYRTAQRHHHASPQPLPSPLPTGPTLETR